MKEKVCAIILTGCLALGMAGNTTVYAAGNLTESVEERGAEADGFEYSYSGNGVEITGYTGEPTDVVIPLTLDGKTVIGIGEFAFMDCSSLTSVTFKSGSSVTSIGDYAFRDCSSLTSVTIPSSVTEIYEEAFTDCKGLTDVTILFDVAKFFGDVFSYWDESSQSRKPSNITIHCLKGSTAEAFAKKYGYKYDYISIDPKKVAITLNGQTVKGTLKVKVNKSYNFKAAVDPADATDKTVAWSSSDKKVATVKNGKVTIKKAGAATITAKTANGKTAKIKLKAVNKAVKVTKIKITGSTTMKVKGKQTLTLSVAPATADNTKVTWSSSNKKVATVNQNGKVTAKKKGTVTITAKAKDGSGKKGTIKIKIKK